MMQSKSVRLFVRRDERIILTFLWTEHCHLLDEVSKQAFRVVQAIEARARVRERYFK